MMMNWVKKKSGGRRRRRKSVGRENVRGEGELIDSRINYRYNRKLGVSKNKLSGPFFCTFLQPM